MLENRIVLKKIKVLVAKGLGKNGWLHFDPYSTFVMGLYRRFFSEAVKTLDKLKRLKAAPESIEKYKNQLYDLIHVRRDPHEAKKLATFMFQAFEPSLHLYNVLLKSSIWMNDVDGIKSTLGAIASNNFAFNAVTLNLLLVYYRDLGMMTEAEKLFEAIEKRQSPLINCPGPNLAAITTMMTGWKQQGNFLKVRHFYEKLAEYEIKPDEFVLNVLLLSALEAKDYGYFDKVIGSGIERTFVIEKTILRSCIERGQSWEASFDRIITFNSPSLELSEILRWSLVKSESFSLAILQRGLKANVRVGDPKIIHRMIEKVSLDGLVAIGELALEFGPQLLPMAATRFIQYGSNHQSDPRINNLLNSIRNVFK